MQIVLKRIAQDSRVHCSGGGESLRFRRQNMSRSTDVAAPEAAAMKAKATARVARRIASFSAAVHSGSPAGSRSTGAPLFRNRRRRSAVNTSSRSRICAGQWPPRARADKAQMLAARDRRREGSAPVPERDEAASSQELALIGRGRAAAAMRGPNGGRD